MNIHGTKGSGTLSCPPHQPKATASDSHSCGEAEETQEGTRIVSLWSQGKAAARTEQSREQGELGQGSLTAASTAQALKYPRKPSMESLSQENPALPAAVLGELSCPSHSALPFHGNGMWDGLTGHPAEAPLRGVWSSGAAPGAEFSPNTEKRPELKP